MPQSKLLQKTNINFKFAVQLANGIKLELQKLRITAEEGYSKIFEEVKILAYNLNIEIQISKNKCIDAIYQKVHQRNFIENFFYFLHK